MSTVTQTKNKLTREGAGVYSFVRNGQTEIVKRYFVSYIKNHSKYVTEFSGWGTNEFNTFKTLKEFKKAYNLF